MRACEPFVVELVFHVMVYGSVTFSAPRLAPSSLNCTPTTPTLSAALADTITDEPETVALFVGAVMVTVGGVVSGSGGLEVFDLPQKSHVARPLYRTKFIPESVRPSRPTRLAGTSSRAHCPAAGSAPMGR